MTLIGHNMVFIQLRIAVGHTRAVCLFDFNLVETENFIVVFNNKTFLFANIKSY